MSDKKEFLTEERYEASNKKIKKIALIILIVGMAIGIALILFGVYKQNEAKRINQERYDAAYAQSEKLVEEANKRLAEISDEKTKLTEQKTNKNRECDSIPMGTSTWFADVNACQSEVQAITRQINDLEAEEFKIENANYKVTYTPILEIAYTIFYFIGGGVILTALVVSGIIWLITKRRAIRAYAVQSTLPVNQEIVDKVTPTVSNAAGSVAGSIAEGISRGIKKGKE